MQLSLTNERGGASSTLGGLTAGKREKSKTGILVGGSSRKKGRKNSNPPEPLALTQAIKSQVWETERGLKEEEKKEIHPYWQDEKSLISGKGRKNGILQKCFP